PVAVTLAELPQFRSGTPGLEVHRPDVSLATNLRFEPFAEGIHGGDAHAMQPARAGLVAALAVELAARVNLRQHDFQRRLAPLIGHRPDGDAASVVDDRRAAVSVDGDLNPFRIAGHGFVDRVVDDLEH